MVAFIVYVLGVLIVALGLRLSKVEGWFGAVMSGVLWPIGIPFVVGIGLVEHWLQRCPKGGIHEMAPDLVVGTRGSHRLRQCTKCGLEKEVLL